MINLEELEKDPWKILKIDEPTEEQLEIAIFSEPRLLKIITNPTEKMCLIAVKQNVEMLQYVGNQKEAICLDAIKKIKMRFDLLKIKQKRCV